MRRFAAIPLGLLMAVSHAAAVETEVDIAIRQLRQAISPERDGSHLPLLFGLRQLRDPDLRPLFAQLLDAPNVSEEHRWQLQSHAVLALAEIDQRESGGVDAQLVAAVMPLAQEAIIANALDLKLLSREAMEELLALESLPQMPQVMLIAEISLLARNGGDSGEMHPDHLAKLRELAARDEPTIAGLASLLLAESGEKEAFTEYRSRLEALPVRQQRRAMMWLFDAIRQYELSSAGPWLNELLRYRGADLDEESRLGAAITLLWIDGDAKRNGTGLQVWRAFLAEDSSYRRRVQCGQMLLARADKLPPGVFDELSGDEDLIVAMRAAGRAVAAGTDAAQHINNLLDLGHARTTEWAMSAMEKLPPVQMRGVCLHIIDSIEKPRSMMGGGPDPANRAAMAVKATSLLVAVDPDALRERLLASRADSITRQAILLGLFETNLPIAGELAALLPPAPGAGLGRADALALLLVARHSETLDSEQVRRLGMIASGGSRVSEVLRAQAAWLYLRHSGRAGEALASLR